MTLPLVFLAAVTCVAGFIPFGKFVSSDGAAYAIHIDRGVAAVSLCVAAAAIALATWMYARDKQPVADRLAATFSGLHRAAYRRFYIDEVYQFITHRERQRAALLHLVPRRCAEPHDPDPFNLLIGKSL